MEDMRLIDRVLSRLPCIARRATKFYFLSRVPRAIALEPVELLWNRHLRWFSWEPLGRVGQGRTGSPLELRDLMIRVRGCSSVQGGFQLVTVREVLPRVSVAQTDFDTLVT